MTDTSGGAPSEPPVDPSPVRRSPDPLLLVLAAIAVGVGLIVDHRVQLGLYICAASLVLAAVLRLTLRPRAAGNLVVRSRHADVAVLLAAAVAVAVLAAITPFPKSA